MGVLVWVRASRHVVNNMARRRVGPSQSPVVPATVARIDRQHKAAKALRWGAISSAAMMIVLTDM